MEAPSFVELAHVYVDYVTPARAYQKLLGRAPQTHSVLRNVTLNLGAGAVVTVFGAPAAGKSTLLRLLAGGIPASRGTVRINGQTPSKLRDVAAGYVSSEENERDTATAHDVLYAFGTTHRIDNLPARIGEVSELVRLGEGLHRAARGLSSTERLRLNMARAALSKSPLILLDDVADELGVQAVRVLLPALYAGRTVIVATRFAATAEALDLPIVLLHGGTLAHFGTCDEIASAVACPRTVDVWIEGLRYDVLRALRQHPGVVEVRLLTSSRFAGQRLRITLQSARYLPSLYDLVSQATLVKVQELPISLDDILARL